MYSTHMNYYFESQSNQSLKQDNHYYFSLFLSLSLFPLSPSHSSGFINLMYSHIYSLQLQLRLERGYPHKPILT